MKEGASALLERERERERERECTMWLSEGRKEVQVEYINE